MLSLQPDAHLGSRIDPATKSLSGPCRCLATPSKPRANGLSEGRGGYLGGRRSAGRRRRRSAGRSAGRWRSPWRSVGRVAVSVSVGPSFTRRENARISRQFQFKTFGTLPNLCLPENKVDASRRAEKCRSLRVRKRGKVEMRPSAMRAGRPCTAQGVAESVRSDTAPQPGTTSSGPQA